MPIDRSNALVTITLEGLFVICKNDRINPPRWEIGVPKVQDTDCPHTFTVQAFKVTGSGIRKPVTLENFVTNRSIEITNNESVALPVEYFSQSGPLNRPNDNGDPHDYRWLVDLESRDFHDSVVEAKSDVAKHHKVKVSIDGGRLYTLFKTVERYKRFSSANDVLILDKLGLSVGIDIPRGLNADSAVKRTVHIQNRGASQPAASLVQEIGLRYEIELKNVCEPAPLRREIDFDLYYQVLKARDGKQFQIITKDAPITEPDGRGGNEPQVCNVILLGQSFQLPGVSEG
jgi:hypothetical protein